MASGTTTPPPPAKSSNSLQEQYPWTKTPFLCSAPMRLISGPSLVHAVTTAGGLGFLGEGVVGSDTTIESIRARITTTLSLFASSQNSTHSQYPADITPFGIGFLIVGHPSQSDAIAALSPPTLPHPPAAIWLFPASSPATLQTWAASFRTHISPRTKIWIQVGSVAQALEVARLCAPDVLVIQGNDAGGHGLSRSASLMTLLPEVGDALRGAGFAIPLVAAGGIGDGRGVAAAVMLGADGCAMGTRFLGSPEAEISAGYRQAVLDASDGGQSTVRTGVYDKLRGTAAWPEGFDGRAVKNRSWEERETVGEVENKEMYARAMREGDAAWGVQGRATTYAGTVVGLVRESKPAGEIVEEVREEARSLLAGGGCGGGEK